MQHRRPKLEASFIVIVEEGFNYDKQTKKSWKRVDKERYPYPSTIGGPKYADKGHRS